MQILSVIIIIGILIFVHELGHFLAAKSLKIPVKIFSIGFPLGNFPPLIKFNWKETECQLNIVPLGGFCAFMDDEKDVEKNEHDMRLLNNRKVWERFIVISGGVTGNMIFAFILAVVMFFSLGIPEGRQFSDGVLVVDVKANSPADKAGIKTLDTIIQVDDVPLSFEYDLKQTMENLLKAGSGAKTADIGYLDTNGEKVEKSFSLNSKGALAPETEEIRGILITKLLPGSTAEKAGIDKNNIIIEIGGKDFKGVRNPEGLMKEVLSKYSNGKPVPLKIIDEGKIKDMNAFASSDGKLGIGIEFIKGLLVIANKSSDKEVIPVNSIILEINKNALYDTSSMMKQLINKHKDGSTAKVIVKRQDKELSFNVIPESTGLMGVHIQGAMKEIKRPPNSIIEPFTASFNFISGTTILLCDALIKMFTGQMSLSDVGGPIMVVAKGSEIAQADFSKLFHFSILISIELVILNLLPIPAVDGGHLFFLIIEKIRGKRLPREFEEKIHYTGLMLLLGLGLFLIFKDVLTISRIIR